MNKSIITAAIISASLMSLLCMSITIVSAQQTVADDDVASYVIDNQPLDQARLDQVLAPIALYPDSLLSQILVAATYPLEVVQATRWRQANQSLSEQQALDAIEDKQWDPSVKALTPFTDLIARLSKDLDWLQQLGDAFLQNQDQVLASIQTLRQQARDNGSIADNDYYDIVEEDDNIIINSTSREIIYVPYYDSRVVYGAWGWNDHQPIYWRRPAHSRLHAGFYWSDRFFIRPTIFFGGFHWRSRNLVVNHHFYDRPYRHNNRYRNIRLSDYRHWNHNPVHRRGVRYSGNIGQRFTNRNRFDSRIRENRVHRETMRNQRRDGNRIVSSNPRSRDHLRLTERTRAQQPTTRPAASVIVSHNQSYRSRVISNRSAPVQQSVSRAERNDANPRSHNNSVNTRAAAVVSSLPRRNATTNQTNTSSGNDKADRRSTVRNHSNPRRQNQPSKNRPHKQRN